jgi:hypothetical protein
MSSPDFLIVTEYMELGTLTEILLNKKYIIEDFHKQNMAIDCCCGMGKYSITFVCLFVSCLDLGV